MSPEPHWAGNLSSSGGGGSGGGSGTITIVSFDFDWTMPTIATTGVDTGYTPAAGDVLIGAQTTFRIATPFLPNTAYAFLFPLAEANAQWKNFAQKLSVGGAQNATAYATYISSLGLGMTFFDGGQPLAVCVALSSGLPITLTAGQATLLAAIRHA